MIALVLASLGVAIIWLGWTVPTIHSVGIIFGVPIGAILILSAIAVEVLS